MELSELDNKEKSLTQWFRWENPLRRKRKRNQDSDEESDSDNDDNVINYDEESEE
jgi:hypothetical protein